MVCEFSELCRYLLTFSTKASLSSKDTQLGCVVRQMYSQTQRTVLAYEHHPYMLRNIFKAVVIKATKNKATTHSTA